MHACCFNVVVAVCREQEARDKFKGWVSVPSQLAHIDLSYKKVGDGHPLRLWKCSCDVEAPPVEVLNRVLRERYVRHARQRQVRVERPAITLCL